MGGDGNFPANALGGAENLWVTTNYGLSQLWVRTASTVFNYSPLIRHRRLNAVKLALGGGFVNSCKVQEFH